MGFSLSNLLSGGNERRSINAAKNGVKEFDKLETPDVREMILQLDELVQQGQLSPEQAQAYLQEASASSNIKTDPALMRAQMDALGGLQEISQNKGLTAADRAQLSRIASEESARNRGLREATMSDAEARGMGGSGMALASNLINNQGQANRESQRDLDVAALAEERAMQALMGGGQLAGQIQSTSFGQQMDQARQQDAINQFNTSTRTNVGLANTAARNNAQEKNLGERQRVSDANVGIRNDEQANNKQLAQLDYENRYKKAAGKAGAYGGVSGAYGNAAANSTNIYGSALQAGGTAAAKSDERSKMDIEDFTLDDILDHVEPKKYKYKDPQKDGKGDQVGIMAQSLEKVAPQMIENTPDGKYIDYSLDKSGGPLFSILLGLAKDVKDLKKGK